MNAITFRVWERCDGQRSVASVAADLDISEEYAALAIHELDKAGLVTGTESRLSEQFSSRRAVMKRFGAAAAIPAVLSVTAPLAAQAQSGCVERRFTIICNVNYPTCEGAGDCSDPLIQDECFAGCDGIEDVICNENGHCQGVCVIRIC